MVKQQHVSTLTISLLAVLWLAILIQYVPARYSYDWDSSQLGRAVTEYSIEKHQPHPPGYPLWVAAARIVAKLTPDISGALSVLALLLSISGLIFFWLTVRELTTEGQSVWLVPLLAFSPPVLFYSAAQSSYSSDLFVACAAGYFAVRIEKGARGYFLAFCVFLALAMGLRQSGAVFLIPLLMLSGFTAWQRSKTEAGLGIAVGAGVFAAWFVPFVRMAGGWAKYREMTSHQFEGTVSRTSILFGAAAGEHQSMVFDLGVWIAASLVGIACAVAILRLGPASDKREWLSQRMRWMVFLWGSPNLVFVLLLHFPKPGYLMLSLPALLIVIGGAAPASGRPWKPLAAGMAGVAVSLAVAFFPYQDWGPQRYSGLLFQIARYMPPALSKIDADNRLLANALAEAGAGTPVVCLHWSGESPNCRSAPWDFSEYRWAQRRGFPDSLSMGAEALFLCDRAGPPSDWRLRMRDWTPLAEGWQMSVWRARK